MVKHTAHNGNDVGSNPARSNFFFFIFMLDLYSKKDSFNYYLRNYIYLYILNKTVRKKVKKYKIYNENKVLYFDNLVQNYISELINIHVFFVR